MTTTLTELETSYFNAGNHGHWTVCEAGGGDTVAAIEIDDPDRAEQAANLFAAAPVLLAALQETERVIRWAAQESQGRVKSEIVGGWLHHAGKARAAIAAATAR